MTWYDDFIDYMILLVQLLELVHTTSIIFFIKNVYKDKLLQHVLE